MAQLDASYGYGDSYGTGYGDGGGYGYGTGSGYGYGSGEGSGYGYSYGDGDGSGHGYGDGFGFGNGVDTRQDLLKAYFKSATEADDYEGTDSAGGHSVGASYPGGSGRVQG